MQWQWPVRGELVLSIEVIFLTKRSQAKRSDSLGQKKRISERTRRQEHCTCAGGDGRLQVTACNHLPLHSHVLSCSADQIKLCNVSACLGECFSATRTLVTCAMPWPASAAQPGLCKRELSSTKTSSISYRCLPRPSHSHTAMLRASSLRPLGQ